VLPSIHRRSARASIVVILSTALVQPVAVATAHATPARATGGTAVAGHGPVVGPLPPDARPRHGAKDNARPPAEPPAVAAAGPARARSLVRAADAPPQPGAATNLLMHPGFLVGDTSLALYFDAADSDVARWKAWTIDLTDQATGEVQQSAPLTPADLAACGAPRAYCRALGAAGGWTIEAGHHYQAAIDSALNEGGDAVSDQSAPSTPRTTIVPPSIPPLQAAGCACNDALAPAAPAQAFRGANVNTATGDYTRQETDARMPAPGIPFDATRRYSSANPVAGEMGIGWAWTYDIRVVPATDDSGSATVIAEDGAQATYRAGTGDAYVRPAGIRSDLSRTAGGGWKLVTPDQESYTFDGQGRLVSILTTRGLGTTVAYLAHAMTITDAAGRVVQAALDNSGRVTSLRLPDGRTTRYRYTGAALTSVTDATGATWAYTYTGGRLATVIDPRCVIQLTNTYDADGRIVAQTDADGAKTTFAWDAGKQQATTVDPDGVGVVDSYHDNVLLQSQNGNGDSVNVRYDGALNPNLSVDPRGNQQEGSYDGAGNLVSLTAPEPFSQAVTNTYDAHNNLTAHVDAAGKAARFGYSAFDELDQVTDPVGDQIVLSVDDRGLVTAVKDGRGKVTAFAYDKDGNAIARTSPLGEKTAFGYDRTGRLVSTTDPRGTAGHVDGDDFTTRYKYDEVDRLIATYLPGIESPARTVYDSVGQVVAGIDPLDRRTEYDYDKVAQRLLATRDAAGGITRSTYTAAGRVSAAIDAEGDRTTYRYDGRGYLVAVVAPRGNVKGADPADFTTSYTYDSNGEMVRTSHRYPDGTTSVQDVAWDELGRATRSTDELGHSSTATFDANGQITGITDPQGNTTAFGYDDTGRQTTAQGADGNSVKVEYDEDGSPVKRTSATGGVTTFTYDDDERLISQVDPRGNVAGADPAAYTTRYVYDAAGNLTTATDPAGGTVNVRYDGLNQVTAATDPTGGTTRYRHDDAGELISTSPATIDRDDPAPTEFDYDALGRLTSQQDPNGHTTHYDYDRVGRQTSITDPLHRTTQYRYDADGNLTQTVMPGAGDPAKRTITNSYDLLGREVRRQLGGDGPVYTFGYDAHNRVTSLGDPDGTQSQAYDNADELTQVTRGARTFKYGYDKSGNLTSTSRPDGTTITSGYDASQRMTSLDVQGGPAGGGTTSYTFGYDPAGRLLTTTGPSGTGLVTTRGYDADGRLSSVQTATGQTTTGQTAADKFTVQRNAAGDPTMITTSRGDAKQDVAYAYDARHRLTSACYQATTCTDKTSAAGRIDYKYDDVGNRLSQTLSGSFGKGRTSYQYDSADQLLAASNGKDTTRYGYDAMGNQNAAGPDRFTYQLDHSMSSATVDGRTSDFVNDAHGLQLTATTGSATRRWDWDVNASVPQVAGETRTGGSSGSSLGFVDGPGGPLAVLDAGQQAGAHTVGPDWLGGTASLFSPDGTTEAGYDYDPYGQARTDGTAGSATPAVASPIQFDGGYADDLLGDRYSFPARSYDPSTGRFSGTDPVAAPAGSAAGSSYTYVGDRPTELVDPSGAAPFDPADQATHDQALRLALWQLDARYGPTNVYGDVPERRMLNNVAGRISAKTVNPQPDERLTGYPDIIATAGNATFVWDVKHFGDQLSARKYTNGADVGTFNSLQLTRYVNALAAKGYPNVQRGPDIVPASETDANGDILRIFSSADWWVGQPAGRRQATNASGIIYYQKSRPQQRKQPAKKKNNQAQGTQGAQQAAPATPPVTTPGTGSTTSPPVTMDPGAVESDPVGDLIIGAGVVVTVVVIGLTLPEDAVVVGGAAVIDEVAGTSLVEDGVGLVKSMFDLAA
jgi:RHS repeat-associated protein